MFAWQSKKGLILVRTGTLLLVATYSESMFPSVCVEATEKLGEFLLCHVSGLCLFFVVEMNH